MEPISTRQFLTNLRIVNLLHIDSKTGALYENSWRQFQNSNFVSLSITGFIFLFLGCRQCNVIRYSVFYKIFAKSLDLIEILENDYFLVFREPPAKARNLSSSQIFFMHLKTDLNKWLHNSGFPITFNAFETLIIRTNTVGCFCSCPSK